MLGGHFEKKETIYSNNCGYGWNTLQVHVMDELDLTSAESKATYEGIKSYVAKHNDGMKPDSLSVLRRRKRLCLGTEIFLDDSK